MAGPSWYHSWTWRPHGGKGGLRSFFSYRRNKKIYSANKHSFGNKEKKRNQDGKRKDYASIVRRRAKQSRLAERDQTFPIGRGLLQK